MALSVLILWAAITSPAQPVHTGEKTSFFWSIDVAKNEVAGNTVCIGCSIRVDGTVNGDAVAVGGNIIVNGSVAGDAVAAAGDVRLGPGARVVGDAIAAGGYLVTDVSSKIDGDGMAQMSFVHTPGQRALHWPAVLILLGMNVAVAIVGSGVLGRRRLEGCAAAFRQRYLLVPLIGTAVLALTVTLGLTTEYLGPFEDWGEVVFLCLLFGGTLVGVVCFAFLVGSIVLGKRPMLAVMITGAVAVTVVLLVPVAGFFFLALLYVFGVGMVAVSGIKGLNTFRT